MLTLDDLTKFTKDLSRFITFNTENLYEHTITLRGTSSMDKIIIQILDNNAFDLTVSQIEKYIKDDWSFTSEQAAGNMYGYPIIGYTGNNTAALGIAGSIYYATDNARFEVLKMVPGANTVARVFGPFSIYLQKTKVKALNNVNKPSYKTVSTKLSLGGTAEDSANVNWTCYKYPLGDGKFKYEWVGNYSQTKNVAVTSAYGQGFMSAKFSIVLPDSKMSGKCMLYAGQSGSTCWVAPSVGGSNLDFYLIRNTSNTRNDTVEINITCSYVANS